MIFTHLNIHPSSLAPPPSPALSTSSVGSSIDTAEDDDGLLLHVGVAHTRRETTKAILRAAVRMSLYTTVAVGGFLLPSFETLFQGSEGLDLRSQSRSLSLLLLVRRCLGGESEISPLSCSASCSLSLEQSALC